MSKKIRCALVSMSPFPIGNVSTIRYTSYLKSLALKGIYVKVFILTPSKTAAPNKMKEGTFEGIHFQYISRITWEKQPSLIIKGCYYIQGLIKSVKYIRQDKINCLILYHQETFAYFFYWFIANLFSISYITDKSEYPYGYSKMSNFRKKIEGCKLKVFDGFIVITQELVKYYTSVKSKHASIFHLPMTINMDRFKEIQKEESEPYIAVVFGTHNRDGLYESIIAYHKYYKLAEENAFQLVLLGDFDRMPNKDLINKYIEDNNLKSVIEIRGLVPINDMPSILANAKCLLTTPTEYISGGFPTKLGEYMLSNVPIVATAAGEISNYITNDKEMFLSQPNNLDGVANSLLHIQNNPKHAKEVAETAYAKAKEIFNPDNYSDALIEFLSRLQK